MCRRVWPQASAAEHVAEQYQEFFMIPVGVSNLSISNVGFVVFLKGGSDERTLPIFIGAQEAQAIAIELNSVTPPRPLTHDLMKNILDVFEARLERIVVHKLEEGTFYGKLALSFEGQNTEVDARPSDAIALALRCKAPIFVADDVMNSAGFVLEEKIAEAKPEAGEADAAGAESGDRLSQLRRQLAQAVADERYEDAARLRDEIRQSTQSN